MRGLTDALKTFLFEEMKLIFFLPYTSPLSDRLFFQQLSPLVLHLECIYMWCMRPPLVCYSCAEPFFLFVREQSKPPLLVFSFFPSCFSAAPDDSPLPRNPGPPRFLLSTPSLSCFPAWWSDKKTFFFFLSLALQRVPHEFRAWRSFRPVILFFYAASSFSERETLFLATFPLRFQSLPDLFPIMPHSRFCSESPFFSTPKKTSFLFSIPTKNRFFSLLRPPLPPPN